MQWSPQQTKVIETRDKNILVSAAAGSGKTAVLVERIIQKIVKDGKDVDRMLVVTFTNAAAGEMRERVLKAIERELELQPENEHLQRQQAYIHNAHITTIHSFCLNLLREHYLDLQLDPGFQIGDTNEIKLMKDDVLKTVLEEEYVAARPEFLDFINQFMSRNSDKDVESMILNLYEEAMGYPWPEEWLDDSISVYDVKDEAEFIQTSQFLKIKESVDEIIQYALAKCRHALLICDKPDGPFKYRTALEQDILQLENILAIADYSGRQVALKQPFVKLPRVKATEVDEELKDQVAELRKKIKKLAGEAQQFYQDSMETILEDLHRMAPIAKEYVRVTKLFMEAFQENKRSKNVVDFNDFEQYAVRILVKRENGMLVPTKVADALAAYYDEVMIDEYQDSNYIQEMILGMISKERMGIHNRFMVGDVKQSIYGFRGAMPDIFVDKYNRYVTCDGRESDTESDVKIILDKNFRSRRTVLEFTNALFRQVMSGDFGGIDYDEENQLNVGADYDEDVEEAYCCEWLFLQRPSETGKENAYDEGAKDESGEENVDGDEEEENQLPLHEQAAMAVAGRMKELVDEKHGLQVRDKGTGEYRTARYSDIVLLLRGMNDAAYIMHDVLNRQGIPCYMESKKGYFDTPEIRTILNFLKVLDNPRQDLPLAVVLKSPVACFTEEELAVVRILSKHHKQESAAHTCTLYDDLLLFTDMIQETEGRWLVEHGKIDWEQLQIKVEKFLLLLKEFRELVNYSSIYDIITMFLERTGYYHYVMAMPAGNRRRINIDLLKERAAAYENGIYKGLFYFIRYIEKMQKVELDMGEASTISETDNTVRMMTIHKSKGLEFPIVILCDIGKEFNFQDSKGRLVLHHSLGVGLEYLEPETRVKKKTAIKRVIGRQLNLDVIQEEIRLLYVACTRAKEKLIFVQQPVKEKRIRELLEAKNYEEELLPKALRTSVKSYFDLLVLALCRNQAFDNIYAGLGELPTNLHPMYHKDFCIKITQVIPEQMQEQTLQELYIQEANGICLDTATEGYKQDVLVSELRERLSYQYPHQEAVRTYGKVSVSDIKKLSYMSEGETENILILPDMVADKSLDELKSVETEQSMEPLTFEPTIPEFMRTEQKVSGANRGTIYHKVFEWFDYRIDHTAETIKVMLDNMQSQGWISKEERAQVRDSDFLTFIQSDLGQRMQSAARRGELHREVQFVLGLYQSERKQYECMANGTKLPDELSENAEDETVLMQGIIDAYFTEEGKLVIVDYKTDNVPKLEVLKKHYGIQLALYQRALEQLTGKVVSEKILYSTKFGKDCRV